MMIANDEIDRVERVIEEIIYSELLYRNNLYKILVNYKPVVNGNRKLATSPLSTLFDILEDICCLTSDLLISLESTKADYRTFAECFLLRERQILFLYSDYCATLPGASEVLVRLSYKDKLAAVLKQIQIEGQHELPLNAELLKPFQHLFTYEILLDKLNQVTSSQTFQNYNNSLCDDEGSYSVIRLALNRIRMILEQINELKRMRENRVRLRELMHGGLKIFGDLQLDRQGELLYEGSVSQLNKSVPRHLILFENCLLVCKKYFTFLIAKHNLSTDNITLCQAIGIGPNDPKLFSVMDREKGQRFDFIAASGEQRRLWVKHLSASVRRKSHPCSCTLHRSCMADAERAKSPHRQCFNTLTNQNMGQHMTRSWPPITCPSRITFQKSKNTPRRTNSTACQPRGLRKSKMGSAPELNEDDELHVRYETKSPVRKDSFIDSTRRPKRRSLPRVYSLKRYADVVTLKSSPAAKCSDNGGQPKNSLADRLVTFVQATSA